MRKQLCLSFFLLSTTQSCDEVDEGKLIHQEKNKLTLDFRDIAVRYFYIVIHITITMLRVNLSNYFKCIHYYSHVIKTSLRTEIYASSFIRNMFDSNFYETSASVSLLQKQDRCHITLTLIELFRNVNCVLRSLHQDSLR